MKAALYARVSTTDKDQNTEVQLSKLREYCDDMGWTVTESMLMKPRLLTSWEE